MRVSTGTVSKSSPADLTNRPRISSFLVKKRCGPTSKRLPSNTVVRARPPTTASRSKTKAFAPWQIASWAAARPEGPPPTITKSSGTHRPSCYSFRLLGRLVCRCRPGYYAYIGSQSKAQHSQSFERPNDVAHPEVGRACVTALGAQRITDSTRTSREVRKGPL